MQAYSDQTKKTYESWDALVEAEADGYVVIIVASKKTTGKVEFANVYGTRPTKEEARLLAARGRRSVKREIESGYNRPYTYKFFVRPNWNWRK